MAEPKVSILSDAMRYEDLFFLSGQTGKDSATGEYAGNDIKSQARQTAINIEAVLRKYGMKMDNILKANCYLTNMEDYADFNEVYYSFFVSRPARTCVAVKELPFGALCEIEVIASIR